MIEIKLSEHEILMAAHAGIMRQSENISVGRIAYYGAGNGNDWQLHIEGCLGEFALAKYLNLFWSGKGKFRGNDVGRHEVRTRSKDFYELILHPEDHDENCFWLLCGVNGTYNIKGWILGKNGKKHIYWKDPAGGRTAYFVPHNALTSPDIMPNL